MKPNIASRVGAVRRSPIALALAIVVPTLAAGVFWQAGLAADTSEAGTVAVAPTSSPSSADPLASSRAALAATTLPFTILGGGVAELTDGGRELDDGANQMSDGLHRARDGSVELADGMTQLQSGLWQLGDGSAQVSGGVDRVVTALTGLGAAQGQIELIVQQTLDSLATSTDPAATAATDQLRTVQDLFRTQGLNAGVMGQLQELNAGAKTLAYQLDDPASEFVSGMVRATDGSGQLRDGIVLLDDGGVKLTDGTQRLVDGTGPMTSFLDSIQANVAKASSSLPAASNVEADPAGSSSTYVVRSASAPWPYLGAVFVMVAGALVGFFVPRVRHAVVATVAVAASMVLALSFADTGASLAGSMTITVLIGVWAVAAVSAARALRSVLGTRAGGVVLAVLGVLQLVVCGIAGPAIGNAGGARVAAFTPLGQLMSALQNSGATGFGVSAIVSIAVALVTTGIAVVVASAHRNEPEPPADDRIETQTEDDETTASVR